MPGPSPLELAAAESLDLPPAGNEALRRQWRHWLDREMGWLDRRAIPLWPHRC